MFLTKENGMRIVEEIKETIGRDVNIMDRTGTILASTDPKRIGQLHTIAKEILEQQLPVLEVAAGEEGPGAQQGVNLPIYVDGNCEGVIGITGPPDAVRDFGAIVKKMTEILLTTMRQQEQSLLVEQARSLFLEEWLFAQNLDWSAFAERGALLDIDIREPKRIAILEYEPRVRSFTAGGFCRWPSVMSRGNRPCAPWSTAVCCWCLVPSRKPWRYSNSFSRQRRAFMRSHSAAG